MANISNSPEKLIIDKCLIIDDKFDEVKEIIFKLNNHTISTDYRDDILNKGVKIDPNTQLVILDLYMSEDQNSIDNALSSVAFLNENIKGPFFLLIWTKHREQFENFTSKVCEDYSDYENFPLDIEMLSATKIEGVQDSTIVDKAVNDIVDYIRGINKKYSNIFCYLKLTQIFQNQSTMFWGIFKPDSLGAKKDPDKVRNYYEDVLGKAFYSFDKSFNYEKSGKGFLNIHAKFLENELTVNPIDYKCSENKLDDKLKRKINSKLIMHEFDSSKPKNGLPGLIYKAKKNGQMKEMMEEFVETRTLENCEGKNIHLTPKESLLYNFFDLRAILSKLNKKNKIEELRALLGKSIDEISKAPEIISFISNNFPNNQQELKGGQRPLSHRCLEYILGNNTIKIGKLAVKTGHFSLNKHLEDILNNSIMEIGKLVITPYCDFAQGKKKEVLYLPILIINDDFKNKSKIFKSNIIFQDLHNGKYLAYKASMYKVCDLENLGDKIHSYYISKEYVNEIQIKVANSISRIGTTIID